MVAEILQKKYTDKGVPDEAGTGCQCDPSAFADEVFFRRHGGYSETQNCRRRTSFLRLSMGFLQMSRIAAKKYVTLLCFCSKQKQTQPLLNLWHPKDQYFIHLHRVTGQKRTPGTLRPVTAYDFFQEYIQFYCILVSSGLFTFTLFSMTHIFCMHEAGFTGKSQ